MIRRKGGAMSISLFEHNQTAYESACKMLLMTGKAAIIHPTGTGKSFIGFKLCEDNPDKRVCWLSPSEYIFRTQIDNWEKAGGDQLPNVHFYTYAKLMGMSRDELSVIEPEYIILDEFHRCGAEMWGKGIEALLEIYPCAKLLGLSATAIRYLDNNRDMADELFDNNIASEMTLGAAVAQGILKAPKYVLSVFSFEKDLKCYADRIRKTKNAAVRIKAEEYLDKLRRTVENADGLDVIFKKHIEDIHGKYLLFVPDVDTMREVKSKCGEWFGAIDSGMHIYTAYCDDPKTSREFSQFKADDSEHLKILIAIDMLNEGIHVENISGVILLRPTVSPIIYKQQIGRALSASGDRRPLIFDIVANVYNLYSVDSIKNEISEQLRICAEADGELTELVDFSVYDEVADCRKLFEQLDDTLSSSWDEMYTRLVRYQQEFGDTNVPAKYKTPDGLSLGNWCTCQRRVYSGSICGILTKERIEKLERIGFSWNPADDNWSAGYNHAAEYFRENGDLLVPTAYVTGDGFKLGLWIRSNRARYRKGTLSEERIRLLQEIGISWNVTEDRWMKNYGYCLDYFTKTGERIPNDYIAPDGSKPGQWLSRVEMRHIAQSDHYTPLTEEQIELLSQIGVTFETYNRTRWLRIYQDVLAYYNENGSLNIPVAYESPSGINLHKWLDYQRKSFAGLNKGTITPERKALLDALGFDWSLNEDVGTAWSSYYEALKTYMQANGGQVPKQKYVTPSGMKLGMWITNQKRKYKAGTLPKEQEAKLRSIGVVFEDPNELRWSKGYRLAAEYMGRNETVKVPVNYKTTDGFPLGEWLRTQVKFEQNGKLTLERRELLDRLGVQWKRPLDRV